MHRNVTSSHQITTWVASVAVLAAAICTSAFSGDQHTPLGEKGVPRSLPLPSISTSVGTSGNPSLLTDHYSRSIAIATDMSAGLGPSEKFRAELLADRLKEQGASSETAEVPTAFNDQAPQHIGGVGLASTNYVDGFSTELRAISLAHRDRLPNESSGVAQPTTERGIIDGFDGEPFDIYSTREGGFINGYATALRSVGRGDEFSRGIILRSLTNMKPVVPGVITAIDGREFTGKKVDVIVDGEHVPVSTLMNGDTIHESFAVATNDMVTLTYTYDSGATQGSFELTRDLWGQWIESGVTLTPQALVEGGIPSVNTIIGNDGDSAGLLNSIMFRDYLSGGSATAITVAATGSISPLGHVEEVGGVHEKVLAAIDARADVVFVPKDNLEEATMAAKGLVKVVGVVSAKQAYQELCENFGVSSFCTGTETVSKTVIDVFEQVGLEQQPLPI